MAGKITDLTAIPSVDRAADQLEIVDVSAGTSNNVTPNNLLGITGNPVGHTDTQTLSNKTLGNTNTLTLKASLFTLQDASDTTKQANFSISGNTTGTTRTYTLPNASVTLASLTGTETLTNKTLTSPTINTPTINNPTLNTDLISEFTGSNGVTVGGVNLKSGALNTNNSVITANITDGAVTPAKLLAGTGSGWAWQSWTPTLTNLTLGNGTQSASYIQIGKTVFFRYLFTFGSSSAMGTGPTISLPVTAISFFSGGNSQVGWGMATCAGTDYAFTSEIISTTLVRPLLWGAAGTYLSPRTAFTAAIPGAWTTANFFNLFGSYEAA